LIERRKGRPWRLITGEGLILPMRLPRRNELPDPTDKAIIELGSITPQRVKLQTALCQWYTPWSRRGPGPTWDTTTLFRLAAADLSKDGHLQYLCAQGWKGSGPDLRVVTGYTPPLEVSHSQEASRPLHTPRGRSCDQVVLRDRGRGQRPRSPTASLDCPPARRACCMPSAVSCASMSLHTRLDGLWGARYPVRQPGNGMNCFLKAGMPWQQNFTGNEQPFGLQKQGQTPDLEAFLRTGLVSGKELGVCKPQVPELRVRFPAELDKAVLRAKLLLEQKLLGTASGTLGVVPAADPEVVDIVSSGRRISPTRVPGTRRNGRPSRWDVSTKAQHPPSAWP